MQVLFNYRCGCGEEFVICESPSAAGGDGWRQDARSVARGLGRGYVDATVERFRCPSCRTIHERRAPQQRAA